MDPFVMQQTSMLTKKPGASDEDIAKFVNTINAVLPEDYIDFIKYSNGAEGFISNNAYLSLDSIDEIIELNKTFGQVDVPWLLLFGTDGGSTGYGFDLRNTPAQIVEVCFPGLDMDPIWVRGNTFIEFLQYLASR